MCIIISKKLINNITINMKKKIHINLIILK